MININQILSRVMKIEAIRRQSLISFIFSFLITVIGLLATMYFAHILGPEILGIYFLFLSYFGLFQLVGDSGIGYATIKRISEGKEQNQFFSAFIALRIILLIVSLVILLFLSVFLLPLKSDNIGILLGISLIISTIFSILSVDVYSLDKIGIYQSGIFLNFVLKIIVQTLFVFLGFSLGGLIWGFIAGYVGGLLFFLRFSELRFTTITKFHLKDLLNISLWVSFSNNAIFLITTIEIIIIGVVSTTTDVGIFSSALQLSSAVVMVSTAICSVIYPKISSWHSKGEWQKIENSLCQSITYSLAFAIPIATGGSILADSLLYFLYGSSFESGYYTLIILFLTQIVLLVIMFQITVLNAINHPEKVFPILFFSVFLMIGLNYYLTPLIGLTGAPIALLITCLFLSVVVYGTTSRLIKIRFDFKEIAKVIFSALVMAMILVGIRLVIPIESAILLGLVVLLGSIVYFSLLFTIDKLFYNEVKRLIRLITE